MKRVMTRSEVFTQIVNDKLKLRKRIAEIGLETDLIQGRILTAELRGLGCQIAYLESTLKDMFADGYNEAEVEILF